MKILILSFYFEPDLCAGSFRTTALVEALKKHHGVSVEVITTLPNRYASFTTAAPAHQVCDGVEINRIALPSHKSGMLDQVNAFSTFYREALRLVKGKDYDLVYATSSRLFTAFLGARIASSKTLPLYLDIRDIFVDTINDILPTRVTWFAKPFLSFIEKYTFSRAGRINLVSKGFREYFTSRYPSSEFRWFTNGIDKVFLECEELQPINASQQNKEIKVLYAGNIGEGQGLNHIVPKLANSLAGKVRFKIIGDGGRKQALVDAMVKDNISNVTLIPPVSRQELLKEYQDADVLFLHLNDYPAFKKVLPSKIFEYASLGKPILAGVSGYAASFLISEVDNAAVFHPSDYEGAKKALESLKLEYTSREQFKQQYSRENIMRAMANDILSFVQR